MSLNSVLFSGVGGQGIVLASTILAKTAFFHGDMVKQSELHGMAQRGGSVISHVRFGSEVNSPLIPKGRADFFVALEELEGLRNMHYLKPGGIVILNTKKVLPPTADPVTNPYPEDAAARLASEGFIVKTVDALEIAREVGNMKVENVIVVGVLSAFLDLPMHNWEQAISESVPQKTVQINIEAFKKGRELYAPGK